MTFSLRYGRALLAVYIIGWAIIALYGQCSAGWSGGAKKGYDKLRPIHLSPSDYPPGLKRVDKHNDGRYRFVQTQICRRTGSKVAKKYECKRIEIFFWARFPYLPLADMAKYPHLLDANTQVEKNYRSGNLPQRPPIPLGDTAAVKQKENRYCKPPRLTSRFVEFGFAVGPILVSGHMSGSAACYGTCDCTRPCPSFAEMYRPLQYVAQTLRKYVKEPRGATQAIPLNCIIDTVQWSVDKPGQKWNTTLYVCNGLVTTKRVFKGRGRSGKGYRRDPHTTIVIFKGKLAGNIIVGGIRSKTKKFRHANWWQTGRCESEIWQEIRMTGIRLTMHPNGTLSRPRARQEGLNYRRVLPGCTNEPVGTKTTPFSDNLPSVAGTWRIRMAGGKVVLPSGQQCSSPPATVTAGQGTGAVGGSTSPLATSGGAGADTPSVRRTVKVPVAIVTPDGSAAGVQQVEIPVGGKGQPPPEKIETPTTPPETKPDTSPGWQSASPSESPSPTGGPPDSDVEPTSEGESLPPWIPAAAGAAAGATATTGALLMMAASGVRPKEVWDGMKDLMSQGPASEPEVVEEYPPEEEYEEPQPETSLPNDIQEEGILYQPPWEIGGPVLMDKAEYEDIQDKLSQGMTWTSGGWKTSEQLDQTERYRESSHEADRLRNEEIVRQQAEERYVDKMVQNSRNIVRRFEDDYSRQEWLQEFIDRHASEEGEYGEKMDPEESLQLYRALRNNLFESRQLMHESDRVYFEEIEKELTKKRDYVAQVRDDAMRANRLLAKLDPTGVGSRIVKMQGLTYAGINGYEEGGVKGAVESMSTSYLDGYTQGFASPNYQILRDYAEGNPYLDKDGNEIPLKEALLRANLQHANDQWNVVDQVSKVQEGLRNGNLRQVFDFGMDLDDATGDFKDFGNKVRGMYDRQSGEVKIPDVESVKGPDEATIKVKGETKIEPDISRPKTKPTKPVRPDDEKHGIPFADVGKGRKGDLGEQRIDTGPIKTETDGETPSKLSQEEIVEKKPTEKPPDKGVPVVPADEKKQETETLKPKADSEETPKQPPNGKPETEQPAERVEDKTPLTEDSGGKVGKEPPDLPIGVKKPSTLTDPELIAKKKTMIEALDSNDTKKIVALYEKGGMKKLADLEKQGHITPKQAQDLNNTITREVNEAVDTGTKTSISSFQKEHNVKINEVLVGDSGSSARAGGAPRSVKTDADRTLVPVFDEDTVKKYAHKENINVEEAHDRLCQKFQETHTKEVNSQLNKRDFNLEDVDYKNYDRIAPKTTRPDLWDDKTKSLMKPKEGALPSDDVYAEGFTSARQSLQGTTTVFKVDAKDGSIHSYKTSGDATVDQNQLTKATYENADLRGTTPTKITVEEMQSLLNQQKKATVDYNDTKSLAKAVDRTSYAEQRLKRAEIMEGRPSGLKSSLDPRIKSISKEVLNNPQRMGEVLRRHGLSHKEFVDWAKKEIEGL